MYQLLEHLQRKTVQRKRAYLAAKCHLTAPLRFNSSGELAKKMQRPSQDSCGLAAKLSPNLCKNSHNHSIPDKVHWKHVRREASLSEHRNFARSSELCGPISLRICHTVRRRSLLLRATCFIGWSSSMCHRAAQVSRGSVTRNTVLFFAPPSSFRLPSVTQGRRALKRQWSIDERYGHLRRRLRSLHCH